MYPSEKALARPEVKAFMDYVNKNAGTISKASQIVPLTSEQATEAGAELKKAERTRLRWADRLEATTASSAASGTPGPRGGAPPLGRDVIKALL